MTLLVLTNSSPGATRNAGTNGDLCTLLDWALPQAGWAIEYTATNARVYRPGTGNRFRLHVRHDSAVSGAAQRALVRGCENASSATVLTDPFPLAAQVGDTASNWLVSSTADTTDRPFVIYLTETFVYYFSKFSSTAETWEMGFFGDPSPSLTDPWGTVCSVRATASNGLAANQGIQQLVSGNLSSLTAGLWWCRDITGATKSSTGILHASGTQLGVVANTPTARAGYGNRIYREYVGVSDRASTTTTASSLGLVKRGWMPNMWSGLHTTRGTVSDADSFTDTAYNALATFRIHPAALGPWVIMEDSDTWVSP